MSEKDLLSVTDAGAELPPHRTVVESGRTDQTDSTTTAAPSISLSEKESPAVERPRIGTVEAAETKDGAETPDTALFVRITIMDRGIGIPEETQRQLFRPFQQAQRLAGGTGLGLFSLSTRMEALGGHRGVDSRPDGLQGSAFWFAFPYRPDNMFNEEKTSSASNSTSTGTANVSGASTRQASRDVSGISTPKPIIRSRNLRILIVDDSLSILKVTVRSATQAGHTCETATNGAIALERLQQALAVPGGAFDVVLIDFQMPVRFASVWW